MFYEAINDGLADANMENYAAEVETNNDGNDKDGEVFMLV